MRKHMRDRKQACSIMHGMKANKWHGQIQRRVVP